MALEHIWLQQSISNVEIWFQNWILFSFEKEWDTDSFTFSNFNSMLSCFL